MNYWDKYYSEHDILEPSKFAVFCLKNHFKKHQTILDLGCGNGRDSYYFYKNGMIVFGVDSSNVIANLKCNVGLDFFQGDFCSLSFPVKLDNIYSRFSLHAINKQDELKLLKMIFRNLKKGGKFCVEARSISDELYGQGEKVEEDAFICGHYRRFINKDKLEHQLKKLGFTLLFSKESRGFAPLDKENPPIIRIIAEK